MRCRLSPPYFDANGRKAGPLGQAAGDKCSSTGRRYFREGKFRWTWSP